MIVIIYSMLFEDTLWDLFTIIELTDIMRQKDDVKFAECLRRSTNDCMTSEDIALLKSRENLDPTLLPKSFSFVCNKYRS